MAGSTERDTLSLRELIAAVTARGCQVSATQVKRLRAEGMLRCLGQEHPQGIRGSLSRYAASEVDQLILVMRIAKVERRFDQRRVLVGWHGGWVDPNALRRSLVAILGAVSAEVRRETDGIEDPEDAADRLIRMERHKGGLSQQRRLIRRRLRGSAGAEQSALYAFAALGLGAELTLREHDPNSVEEPLGRILERAIGLDRARTDHLGSRGPLLPEHVNVEDVLHDLQSSGMLDVREMEQAVIAASDEQLQRAFDDARLLADLALFGEAAEASYGEDVAALGSFVTGRPDGHDATTIAILVRNMLIMRSIVPDDALEAMADAVESARLPLTAQLELRNAFPEHAHLLTFDMDSKLAELPAGEAEKIRHRFQDFIRSRLDLRPLLDSGYGS
jgi:hypothetical protein